MARYDTKSAWFRTPRGRAVMMYCREETNDWNTCQAAMTQDEYGLADLRLEGVALDIGGHIGSVSLALLIDNPDLQVVAVEPIPANVEMIRRNAQVNSCEDRLTVWQMAAGDGEPVTVRYAFVDNENDLHHAYIGNAADPDFTLKSPERVHSSITVNTLTAGVGPETSFIKIDCEGGEWPYLASGDPGAPLIRGEWHPVEGHTREDLVALLPQYDVTFSGPEGGPGGFHAVRRPDAGGS